MGTVVAVCTSPAKGTQKTDVKEAVFIEDFGIEGDAHAGKWHRQVSLLSYDKIRAFQERGARVGHGADCGDVVLEITQIGKECHHGCRIFQEMGDCIMPREGVFAKVVRGGVIKAGDRMRAEGYEED